MINKIYPQAVTGEYRKIKNYLIFILLILYFGIPWIRWTRLNDAVNQAIMIDLPNRKAYLFSIIIWPQEAYYVTGLLILAAFGLFFFTSLFGRLWCGYTCPHTVFVDIFRKVEYFFQGDRNTRIKLDQEQLNKGKFYKKAATHITWLTIGFSFAFGWVSYFYDAPTIVRDISTFSVSTNATIWLVGLTISTYLFAGFIKEKVCLHMCPYGRFQSAMLDNDTSVVTYNYWRGEPRGHKNDDKKLGDCVDCNKCFLVCPMGIDIRNGLQMACIGCGLCIDACNSVMDILKRPRDLISYDSINSTHSKITKKPYHRPILSVKTILFGSILLISSCCMVLSLVTKSTISTSITRGDGPLVTITADGYLRNSYNLLLTNKTNITQDLIISISGLSDAEFLIQGSEPFYDNTKILLNAEEEKSFRLFVKIKDANYSDKDINFTLTIKNPITHEQSKIKMNFIIK